MSPLLKSLNIPILSSNVLLKNVENQNLKNSVVFDLEGRKVGIVGYLKPEARMLDSAGNIEYIDEVLALSEEVANLKVENVDIIIALGHSDNIKDLEIAREIEGIDIVIGGRKNKFFWSGQTVEDKLEEPTIVTQKSGKQVLVVSSHAYSKYLGRLNVKFDSNGDIIDYKVSPILLGKSITDDAEALLILNKYSKDIAATSTEVLGDTSVVLDGDSCRTEECNFGNLIADAIMYYYAVRFEGDSWTDAAIAVIQGGAIASSIAPSNRPASVTRGDILAALPEESNLIVVTMNGTIFNQFLEHSVANYDPSNPNGEFLQYSGVRVIYDFDREPGSRVTSAVVRCWSCVVPQLYVIDDWRTYKTIMPSTLLDEKYGYSMLTGLPIENLDYDEVTCLSEYITLRTPVYPEVSGRIVLENAPDSPPEIAPESPPENTPDSATTFTSSIIILGLALLPRIIA